MFKPGDLFDLSQTEHASLFEGCEHAWEALARIADYLKAHLKPGLHNQCQGVAWVGDDVFIGEGTVLEDGVMIKGPAIIGRHCEIRHNAYLRGNVLVGDHCVVGNATELKNTLLFNHCEAPHYNYVGDSILGYKAHLGAGVKISNLKVTRTPVVVEHAGRRFETGLRKFGALIGDRTEVGCNAVLNPGSILGRDCLVYPNVNWRGVLAAGHIAKNRAAVEVGPRKA
ncbi:MAG: UDP-N-acetylglucosamine diphosphorylase [Verrucomicrobia bacterium]|jgi:NDP-sugar pyrophosphorylase family protein|nr:UDP-N-acetylglucosamine diphosphorylase [Verrucomicrobiota bacterium]